MYRLKILAVGVCLMTVAGCSLFGGSGSDTGPKPNGLAVGDEPFAVRAGATLLADGGSAADAAAAIYFALSVTYPVSAGLGGGGLCIVHDPNRHVDAEIDFLPRDAAHAGAYAVPGAVSGIAFLQSHFGNLPWQRVVAPAEGLASTGFPVSHALATRLAENQDLIRLDAGLSAEFLDESGNVKPEGAIVNSPVLAQSLATIRILGPAGFYEGGLADKLITYATAEGGAISATDLRAYTPGYGPAMSLKLGEQVVLLPSRRVGAGTFVSAMLSHLVDQQGALTGGGNLASAVAAATKTTLDEFHIASLPRDMGATGFAVTDSDGQAVACAATMNGPFGSGHTAAGTGITLAKSPSSGNAGLAAAFLSPAVSLNDSSLVLAGAGAGGPNGTAAIIYDMLRFSQGVDTSRPLQLHPTGLEPYETINVIACPGDVCVAIPDPAAHGLGAAGGGG